MPPLLVRETRDTDNDLIEWTAPDGAAFIDRVLERAAEKRMQAPFLPASAIDADTAAIIGVPSLAGQSGAMILFNDGSTRFVGAQADRIIISGTGAVELDTEANRIEACRRWLSNVDARNVEIRHYRNPSSDLIDTWRAAKDEQDRALAACAEDPSPDNLERLAAATNIRHAAYIALPPTATIQESTP